MPVPKAISYLQKPLPVLLLSLIAAGCGVSEARVTSDENTAQPVSVAVSPVARGDIPAYHAGTATIEALSEATVVARVPGEIVEVMAEEGDQVAAGQPIARLDASRYTLESRQAQATLNKLEQQYRRNVELSRRGLVSASTLDSLRFDLEASRAEYAMKQIGLENTLIRAPIDGVIAARLVKTGATATENQELFKITDAGQLRVRIPVPQRKLDRFSVGQKATIRVDARPDERFEAAVTTISPVVDARSGQAQVTLSLDNGNKQLLPGMFARVEIVYDVHEQAMLLPRAALVEHDGTTSVYVVESGQAIKRTVITGLEKNGQIEILEGLDSNDQVVTAGQSVLADGADVLVQLTPNG